MIIGIGLVSFFILPTSQVLFIEIHSKFYIFIWILDAFKNRSFKIHLDNKIHQCLPKPNEPTMTYKGNNLVMLSMCNGCKVTLNF